MQELTVPCSTRAAPPLPASWWRVSWAKTSCLSRPLGWASLSHQCHLSPFSCSRQFTPLWESNQPHITTRTHTHSHGGQVEEDGVGVIVCLGVASFVSSADGADLGIWWNCCLTRTQWQNVLNFGSQKHFYQAKSSHSQIKNWSLSFYEVRNMQHIIKRSLSNPSDAFWDARALICIPSR